MLPKGYKSSYNRGLDNHNFGLAHKCSFEAPQSLFGGVVYIPACDSGGWDLACNLINDSDA